MTIPASQAAIRSERAAAFAKEFDVRKTAPNFEAILAEAAVDARVRMAVVEKRMQARDHPVLLAVRETQYLKCAILAIE